MSQEFLRAVNWSAPWLIPYAGLGQEIAGAADWRAALNSAALARQLTNFQGIPVRFIPQEELPPGTPYEAHIGGTGKVPTRDNLHDFFNALVWLTFPKIKARLNQLQFEHLQTSALLGPETTLYSVGGRRGALRDAATIFDENAALLISQDPTLQASLAAHCWRSVLLERRGEYGSRYQVILFGHALMEKLVRPYKAITAHCFAVSCEVLPQPEERVIWLDRQVSARLSPETSNSAFFPLPVLGVPGWWPNQDEAFYADPSVFRPRKGSSGEPA